MAVNLSLPRHCVSTAACGFPCCFLEHETTSCEVESQSKETERWWENNAGSGEMGRGSMHSIEAQKFLGPQRHPLNR